MDQNKLNLLKAQAAQAQTDLTRAEATRDAAAKQITEIDAELNTLGVKPEKAEAEIARLDAEIAAKMKEAEELLAGMNQPAVNG